MDGDSHKVAKSAFDSKEWQKFADSMKKSQKEREDKTLNHPDNGKEGWWIVHGLRHTAHVRASSALEAILKAEKAEIVHGWELPEAHFWTKDLPDAF